MKNGGLHINSTYIFCNGFLSEMPEVLQQKQLCHLYAICPSFTSTFFNAIPLETYKSL